MATEALPRMSPLAGGWDVRAYDPGKTQNELHRTMPPGNEMTALLTEHESEKRFLAEVKDSDLIRSCQKGNRAAFEQLVRRHQGKAYAIAYGIVRNRDDALDVTQEAFLRAYRSIGKFRHRAEFSTWLRRIVVNLSIDHLRGMSGKREEPLESDERGNLREAIQEPRQPDGENHALRREMGEVIDWAMQKLPAQQRVAVILRDAEGFSYSEIAHAMGCSKGTVMSRIHYGRQRLQTLLAGYLRNNSEG